MAQRQMTKVCVIAAAMGLVAVPHVASAQTPEAAANATHIYFPTNGSALNAADQKAVRGVAERMLADPHLIATVIGKTDTVGSPEYNEKLSQQRAQAVFEALVATNKVPENRVKLEWTGENQPNVATENDKAEPLNRVADIFLGQGTPGQPAGQPAAAMPESAPQARLFCVVVHISLANVTYLPPGSSVNDCASLAQALEQQPPHLGPGTTYELGCQFGDLFMLTAARPWGNRQVVSGDWLKVKPDAGETNAAKCADAWHVAH